MKNLIAVTVLASVGLGGFGAAHATTYLGSASFDGATVSLSVTTDDVTGALSSADLTSWNINISDPAGTVDLSPANSQVLVTGGLSATPSALSFNFSGSGFALFEQTTIGDSGPFYCVTNGGCYGESTPSVGVSTQFGESPIEQMALSGDVVLATSAVPEPSTWAMMLIGFAGLGVAAYRRKSKPALLAA
jgi:PEP-CTERM motif